MVYLIGAGPGDPGLITLKALKAIESSQAVLYDQLVNSEILKYCSKTTELVFVGKTKGYHPLPQEEINELILEYSKKYKIISRLKGGDPLIFGRGGEEYEHLIRNGVSCEIIPGITAASGIAAAIGLPLTHRDYASELVFLTGHKREDGNYDDFRELDLTKKTCVVYMGLSVMARFMQEICSNPANIGIPVCIIENGTRKDSRRLIGTTDTIAQLAFDNDIKSPALIIMGRVVDFLDEMDGVRAAYSSKMLPSGYDMREANQ